MTAPTFRFGGTSVDTTRGEVSSGEAANEFLHPLLPQHMHASAGFQIVLNGWNLNRAMPDTLGHDGTAATALRMLQMRAPRQPIMPLVSWVGTGRMFRPGAKWRYRWYDSRTGEHSGLSTLPEFETNMGIETPAQSQTYLGQTAYFNIPTADAPAHADTIQLFANTTRQDNTWYLADEGSIGAQAYVALSDDSRDDELYARTAVVTGNASAIPAGPTWSQGIMWPVAKAWEHPSGRTFYYGMRRWGRLEDRFLKVTVNEGDDLCSLTSSAAGQRLFEPGRTGQRVRFYRDTDGEPVDDPTVYRFVKGETSSTFRVTPDVQVSNDLSAGGSAAWYYAIEDDRDARHTFVSEVNKPWLLDPFKVLSAGDDFDDGVMAWFALQDGRIFMQTRRRIYEGLGTISEDPSRSTLFMPRSEEGTTGFDSGCLTPIGYVYLHENRGVRLFDGAVVIPLLKGGDVFSDFGPKSQFEGFEPSALADAVVAYDAEHREVLVSYVPLGQGTRKETLVFDTVTRAWRGPYRDRVSACGLMRSTRSANKFVTGDDFGSLMVRHEQTLDHTPTTTGLTGTGTSTGWTDERFLTDSGNAFDTDGDQRLRGSPIWFTRDSDGALFMARIADVPSTNELELDGIPVSEDGTTEAIPNTGFTYSIGSIRWSLVTAYVEPPGDPAKPVEFYKLDARFHRGTSTTDSFEVGFAEDANGTYAGVRISSSSEDAPTATVQDQVHGEMRLKRHGATGQLRVRGHARDGEPQIVFSILDSEKREGALD